MRALRIRWERCAATLAEGAAFTATSTAISLVLRAQMCQGRPQHIGATQGIQNLCPVQDTTSAAVEGEESTGISTATFRWLKPLLKARCHSTQTVVMIRWERKRRAAMSQSRLALSMPTMPHDRYWMDRLLAFSL